MDGGDRGSGLSSQVENSRKLSFLLLLLRRPLVSQLVLSVHSEKLPTRGLSQAIGRIWFDCEEMIIRSLACYLGPLPESGSPWGFRVNVLNCEGT